MALRRIVVFDLKFTIITPSFVGLGGLYNYNVLITLLLIIALFTHTRISSLHLKIDLRTPMLFLKRRVNKYLRNYSNLAGGLMLQ